MGGYSEILINSIEIISGTEAAYLKTINTDTNEIKSNTEKQVRK